MRRKKIKEIISQVIQTKGPLSTLAMLSAS